MTDTVTVTKLTIAQLCRRIPGARGAERISPSTVARWISAGCPARDGTRVRLRATRAGSRWLVDPADLDAFFAALAADPATPPSAPPPSGRHRDRAERIAAAKRRIGV
jgi:hypothetical protein